MTTAIKSLFVIAQIVLTILTTSAMAYRVAIIGGGASGCAVARRIAQLDKSAQITIYEIGRGLGGRASTRLTRAIPDLYINHGSPYVEIKSPEGRDLISSLGGSSAPLFRGKKGTIDFSTGDFTSSKIQEEEEDPLYLTGGNGRMSNIFTSLVADFPSIETQYSTIVRGISNNNDKKWEIRDKSDNIIGTADWLVVTGSGVAHPRWSKTFGGDPPLVAAAKEIQDSKLNESLECISKIETSPVLATFFACSGVMAQKLSALNYNVVDVSGSSVLSRVMIQSSKNEENDGDSTDKNDLKRWCSVVLHSTEDFALQNTGVFGKSSSAARVGEAKSDVSKEDLLIEEMIKELNAIPGTPDIDGSKDKNNYYIYGPMLHRWGNAFPKGNALSEELSFLDHLRLAFCGDFAATSKARFGSVESALLTGSSIGEKIVKRQHESL